MNVIQAIVALLYDHDTVIVPALGAFVRHDESAQVNVITNEFQKPSSTLSFDSNQREENLLIIEYLMQHENLSDEEARQQIAVFVADCYSQMRESGTVFLEGLGTLSFNNLQELVFEPEPAADFNSDAFGLTDLDVTPVYREPDTSLREETMTQSEEASNHGKRSNLNRLWILMILLLLGAAALWYFKFRPIKPEPQPPTPIDTVTVMDTLKPVQETLVPPIDTMAIDTLVSQIDTIVHQIDTLVAEINIIEETDSTLSKPEPIINEAIPPTEVVKPQSESKAFIVGGCFSMEQNALNMAMDAYEKGCTEAFVMKRGTKYFVCYGQYPTTAEAKEALPGILQNYNQKAWILVK